MIDARIDLKNVELLLLDRAIARALPGHQPVRWAALSAHMRTGDCEQRDTPVWRFRSPSLFMPLDAGYLHRLVERVRSQYRGLDEVRRIWGKGYRAMVADTKSPVVP